MPSVPPGCPLTPRQLEIARLLHQGAGPRQLADHLGVGYSTIRTHIADATRRLGVDSGPDALLAEVQRHDWLTDPDASPPPPPEPTPLAVEHPWLAAYLSEFQRSRWPHAPDARSTLGMRLALAGHRNSQRQAA
jgi:DNA-binding CsgD family transcriptional regulator